MRRIVICMLLLGAAATAYCAPNYRRLNRQAEREYEASIRPGQSGESPFWNAFAKKFIFAPAFECPATEGADRYLYTVVHKATGYAYCFENVSHEASLSKIWSRIPVGDCTLTVTALAKDGTRIGEAGHRDFFRDFPFSGPYTEARRPYREAAIIGLLYVHRMKAIQNWKKGPEPDMSYKHNTYPCKIISATVRQELLLGKLVPEYRDDALAIARNAAEFLIAQSRPEGEPLAFFPPTYYKKLIASARKENDGKTMSMEACSAGLAFLDLYDVTGEKRYLDHAVGIAETYLRLQASDGSFPIKVDFLTGEPVNSCKAILTPVIRYFLRLETGYGMGRYRDARLRAEAWMDNTAVPTFDMTGQFEDVTVLGLKPYQNLTNCTAAPYGQYLLERENSTKDDVSVARDLINLAEDQFVYWDSQANKYGFREDCTPCVFEQYKYAMPVDSSACNVANAWMSLYEATGDELALAKAKAMVDNITKVQDTITGMIPTTWRTRFKSVTFWVNCSFNSVCTLLRMEEIQARRGGK